MSRIESNSGSCLRAAQLFIVDSALTVAGLAALVGGIYSVFYKDSPTITATCIGAGLILLFAATIHRFEVLKGFGIEAKVKKLDATIDKAEIALSQLKDLTEITTKSVLMLSSKAGRWSGAPSVDEAYELAMNAKRALESVGSSPANIHETLLPWANAEARDMAFQAIGAYDKEEQALEYAIRKQIGEIGTPTPAERLAEQQELVRKLNSLSDYAKTERGKISYTAAKDLPHHLRALVNGDAELTPEQKADLTASLQPFIEEIEFLADNLDFQNIDFWRARVRAKH